MKNTLYLRDLLKYVENCPRGKSETHIGKVDINQAEQRQGYHATSRSVYSTIFYVPTLKRVCITTQQLVLGVRYKQELSDFDFVRSEILIFGKVIAKSSHVVPEFEQNRRALYVV